MTIRIPKWLAIVLGLLIFAGAATGLALITTGGSGDKTGTTSDPKAAATTTTADDCDALGINSTERNEGTCIDTNGATYTVVNRNSVLRLPDLTARFVGIEMTDAVSGGGQGFGSATANGTFVIIRLAIKNTGHAPVSFDSSQDQVVLILNNKSFTEDFDAENGPVGDSFVWQQHDIQPGETQVGSVVFDMPNQFVSRVETEGDIGISTFRQVDAYRQLDDVPYGEIRLYATEPAAAGGATTTSSSTSTTSPSQ